MNYALIENGIVSNTIWLNQGNADEFSNAVATDGLSVGIGDAYQEGVFLRDGEAILTPYEELRNIVATLDAALVDAEYRNVLLTLGL